MQLGLHTRAEEAQAAIAARDALAIGRSARSAGRMDEFHYAAGYLNAILDLARMEGANRLARQVKGMIEDLTGRRI